MVTRSKICLICKQDSNNLNPIDSSDVQIVFKQNVPIDVCNSCFGKFELILTFLKSLKRTKNNKQALCSICFKVSLYLFNLNEKNKDGFAEKIQYCNVQSSILPLRNVCYRCLYLTELWYDLKKQYEIVIKDQVTSSTLTSENNPRPILKIKLTIPKNFNEENSEMKLSPKQKRKLSLNLNQEKAGMKSSNKKRKSDTSIEYGETGTENQGENTKLQKLQRKLQLDIRDADAYSKTTKLKRGRNNTNNSIKESEKNVTENVLKPANTYFTNHRKKWLKPHIKSDVKLLNTICNVDLSTSFIPEKVLKRLEERKFVRVKAIASDVENEQQPSPSATTSPTTTQTKSAKKFTAARKFPKAVPKTKRVFQSELEEIRSSRPEIDSPSRKSPVSDRTDFDYGINRHSYDAFSTDKEKVVMVLLHNVEQFDKKQINKRVSDDIASVTSSSTDDDYIDEDEQRLGRFSCLENYMAGLPHLILHRMDNNVNDLNAKVSKKIKKNISFKDSPKDDTDEFITPERNPSFDEIRKEIEKRVKERMAQKKLESENNSSSATKSSSDTDVKTPIEGSSKAISDDDSSVPEETIDLRLSPSEDEQKETTKKTDAEAIEKSQTNIENGTIEIEDDDDDVVCLNEEVVGSKHNGDIQNNTVDVEHNDNENENTDSDAVQCNVEITTTEQTDSNQNENNDQDVALNTPIKEKQFCAVAQKLAELDA
ncbi:uncharacterized protein LOC123299103 [Chrysoperla carnea]|uniref:uncharacterized protein LOC123299103 n=1 Tax=Chrysoperla carnea TaxID=189513 RepID=UPI001D065FE3|nr:uncharacterized protein LOC123299103 [Chrysoperla carnea]